MAPWDCALNFANLNYITSAPGTPENTSTATTVWEKGQPAPPWAYEYQYPVECFKPLWIVPQYNTGFSGGVPIYPTTTGGAPSFWSGPPIKYKVGIDQFYAATAVTVASGGTGYAVGDQITFDIGPVDQLPIGAPAVVQVATAPGGVIGTVTIVNQLNGASPSQSGAYYAQQTNPIAQGSTTGSGSGATFNITAYTAKQDQRVILTNQEFATFAYVKHITDPNIMDQLFRDAWISYLGARLCMALTGDKTLANSMVQVANDAIYEARKADGNEGLTVNDVTPDWIRTRGTYSVNSNGLLNQSYEWGPVFGMF
jgi:hypothetical protein